ncbi:hypothetical protein ES702_07548 [subsurface metagenome]
MAFERISEDKIKRILELAEEGITLREIAQEVGVSVPTASKYISQDTKQKKSIETSTFVEELISLTNKLSKLIELLSEREKPKDNICPYCGHQLFYYVTKEDGPHLFCLNCGAWKPVELPQFHRI